ncbi:RNA binding protein [Paecilomyces variotii No. 5]|uniref:RNA binding protein n=1 Tax=Byssochlamys spectabilis (strain No. 5 / NBRC 109023) TaxID=1356009 RepID=V5FL73_BYSSN|nr:RNA binding protein [Paecilomyces variotii No. 5]
MINRKGSMPAPAPVQMPTMPSPLYDSSNFPTFPYSPSWLPTAHEASNRGFSTGRRTNYQRTKSERSYQSVYTRHRTHSVSPTHYTPSRYVFIQNLAPQTDVSDLKSHLAAAGTVEHCEILEDRRTGRRRSQAKATFQDTEQAKQAMTKLDNTVFMGARIRVKFDRDAPVSRRSNDSVQWEDKDQTEKTERTDSNTTSEPTTVDEGIEREVSSKDSKSGPLVVNGSVTGKKTKDITTVIDYESESPPNYHRNTMRI